MPFLSGYRKRKKITIDNTNVDSSLSDFPLLVKFASDAQIGAVAHATGQNIRFTSSDGVTELKYERLYFNVSGGNATGVFYVKVPTVSGTIDTDIYIYYDNSGAADGQDKPNTWDANYVSVYHMEQDPSGTAPQILDSKSTNHGTSAGSMTTGDLVDAQIEKGIDFDGTDDAISCGDTPFDFERTNSFTLDCIVKFASLTGTARRIISKANATTSPFRGYELRMFDRASSDSSALNLTLTSTGGSNELEVQSFDGQFATGTFYSIATTYNGSSTPSGMALYRNGVAGTNVTNSNTLSATILTDTPLRLGNAGNISNLPFSGIMDEVRISNVVRSAAWLKFQHFNAFEADNEIVFSSEELSVRRTGMMMGL